MDHIYQVKIHFLGRTISEYSSLISAIVKKKKKKLLKALMNDAFLISTHPT